MSLSVQWGYAGNSGGSVDVTFPVSFTKTVYQIQLTYNSDNYENPTYAIKDTKSFRYWSKYGGDKLWLAVGVQQWGLINAEKTAIAFPVAFPSSCFAISITAVYTNQAWSYPVVAQSITRSSFVARTQSNWRADDTARYIAIGCQQWGVIRNSSYSTSWVQSITFPIRFKLAYIAIANAYDVDRTGDHKAEFGCHAFNLTTSGLSYCYHGSAGGDCSDTATYIAIGQAQQWGLASTAAGRDPAPFPIAFPNAVFSVVAVSNYTSFAISGLTLTRFRTTIGSDTGDGILWWIAVGKQQWGVINAPAFPDEGQPVTFPIKFSKIPSVITAINQAKNSVSSTQLFTASINTYTTTSNMILHRYGGLTSSDARVDWFAWSV